MRFSLSGEWEPLAPANTKGSTAEKSGLYLFLQKWSCQSRDKTGERGSLCKNITARLRHARQGIRNRMQFKCQAVNPGLRWSKWMPSLPLLHCPTRGESFPSPQHSSSHQQSTKHHNSSLSFKFSLVSQHYNLWTTDPTLFTQKLVSSLQILE